MPTKAAAQVGQKPTASSTQMTAQAKKSRALFKQTKTKKLKRKEIKESSEKEIHEYVQLR